MSKLFLRISPMMILIMILMSAVAKAADLKLACLTENPTTTFIAQTKNGIIQFDLIHHNGVKYMPIHSGVITPNDLGTLSDRASLLADLGDHLTFTMPAENCQVEGVLFSCFGSQPAMSIGGHNVKIWAAHSSVNDETTLSAGTWSYVTTDLAIEIDGQNLYLPMKYFNTECTTEFLKNSALKKFLKR